jgi:RNA polymerase sigma-70 factor (sigma-E family)
MSDAAFREFVEVHGPGLLHTARLLTCDRGHAEDLVQTALTKLYLKWGRARNPVAYARRTLVSTHIDASRRRWRGERPMAAVPDRAVEPVNTGEDRDELRQVLRALSPQERTVVVLRYYCDLSEKEAAAVRLPVGTVKSAASRALARLRVEVMQ